MKLIILAMLFLTGCNRLNLDVHQSSNGETRKIECQNKCQRVYKTNLDYIGFFSGDCYCQ